MSDFTESTISMIPIRKLEDASGNFYPLSVLESVITSHDIVINTNLGHYNAGDTIPEKTSLDEILGNIFSIDRHILKSKIDEFVLSSETDRVPSSYLVGNLLKYGSAYVKKSEASASFHASDVKQYINGLTQVEGKITSVDYQLLGEPALMSADKLVHQDITTDNYLTDYSESDNALPTSNLVRSTLRFLQSEVIKVVGSMKFLGICTGNTISLVNPMRQPPELEINGTVVNSFSNGNVVEYNGNKYVYYNSLWRILEEDESYTGYTKDPPTKPSTDPTKSLNPIYDIEDTSKIWFDTTSHHEMTNDDLAQITAIRSMLATIQLGFKELYRIVMLGAVPGSIDDNYKSNLTQSDLSQNIDENIPNEIERSDDLIGLKVFGNTYVGNGSQYTAIYNPSGTTKTGVEWFFDKYDEQEITCSDGQAGIDELTNHITNQSFLYQFKFDVGEWKYSFSKKSEALEQVSKIPVEHLTIKYYKPLPQKITINRSINCKATEDQTSKEVAIELVEGLPDSTATIEFDIDGNYTVYEADQTHSTAKSAAIDGISSLPGDDHVLIFHTSTPLEIKSSTKNLQTCEISVITDYLQIYNNTATICVASTQVTQADGSIIKGTYSINVGGEQPIPEENGEPTVPAVCAKRDTSANFAANRDKLIDGELCFFTDRGTFAVYYNQKFYTLKSSSDSSSTTLDIDTLQKTPLSYLQFTEFKSNYTNKETFKVGVDSEGNWVVIPYNDNYPGANYAAAGRYGVFVGADFGINGIYCGGSTIDSACKVSHNFVELANCQNNDISLDGMVLLYTDTSVAENNGYVWHKLDLKGTVKAKSTFVIRGSRCNTDEESFIKVKDFDIEWYTKGGNQAFDETDTLMSFNSEHSSFFLACGKVTENDFGEKIISLRPEYQGLLDSSNNGLKDPFAEYWDGTAKQTKQTEAKGGYIDSCGFRTTNAYTTLAYEKTPVTTNTDNFKGLLFFKWFSMDPSQQALPNKGYSARNNEKFWSFININQYSTRQGNHIQYYYNDDIKKRYAPLASKNNKNFFTCNTKFDEEAPNMVNITFGIQATETNTDPIGGSLYYGNQDATRCFNWISVGYFDEFVEYKKVYSYKGEVNKKIRTVTDTVSTYSDLPSNPKPEYNSIYLISDINKYARWNGFSWEEDKDSYLPVSSDINDQYYVVSEDMKYYWNGHEWKPEISKIVSSVSDLINNCDAITINNVSKVYLKNEWINLNKITNGEVYSYSTTDSYVIGEHCIKDNQIYTCISDITAGTEENPHLWNDAEWKIFNNVTYSLTKGQYFEFKAGNVILSKYVWDGIDWSAINERTETYTQFPAIIDSNDIYYVSNTNEYFQWNGETWLEVHDGWTRMESIFENNISNKKNITEFIDFYKRFTWNTPYGETVTTHKCIVHNLSKGSYQYRVGRFDSLTYQSDIMNFEVKNDRDVHQFNFIQTTDQQGFNWNEYQAWKKTCYSIDQVHQNNFDFTLNTGDIAQSGNRPNEWLDYYNGRTYIRNKVEMYTIGNNDLCSKDSAKLMDGAAKTSKYNHINILRYYNFELDLNNCYYDEEFHRVHYNNYCNWLPKSGYSYQLIPIYSTYSFNYGKYHFISIDSEYSNEVYLCYSDANTNKLASWINKSIERWLRKDLQIWKNITDDSEPLNCSKAIVMMHEMPYTIITNAFITGNVAREGSHLNTLNSNGNYRYSRLFKHYGIRLVIGGHKHTYSFTRAMYDAPSNVFKGLCDNISNLPAENVTTGDIYTVYNSGLCNYIYLDNSWCVHTHVDNLVSEYSQLPSTCSNGTVYHCGTETGFSYIKVPTKWLKIVDDGSENSIWFTYEGNSRPAVPQNGDVVTRSDHSKEFYYEGDWYFYNNSADDMLISLNAADSDSSWDIGYRKQNTKVSDNDSRIPVMQLIYQGHVSDRTLLPAINDTYVSNNPQFLYYMYTVGTSNDKYCILSYGNISLPEYSWFKINESYSLCRIELVSKLNAPSCLMSQASGYKVVSNNELPSQVTTMDGSTSKNSRTPWLMTYFAANDGNKENAFQHSPMYVVYNLNSDSNSIMTSVHQVKNVWPIYNSMSATPDSILDPNKQWDNGRENLTNMIYFEHTLNDI